VAQLFSVKTFFFIKDKFSKAISNYEWVEQIFQLNIQKLTSGKSRDFETTLREYKFPHFWNNTLFIKHYHQLCSMPPHFLAQVSNKIRTSKGHPKSVLEMQPLNFIRYSYLLKIWASFLKSFRFPYSRNSELYHFPITFAKVAPLKPPRITHSTNQN